MISVQGTISCDVLKKFFRHAETLNLRSFLNNLNFKAKLYQNMHLNVLNYFYKKKNGKNSTPKISIGQKLKF